MERICSDSQCANKHYARGLCNKHYLRARADGSIELHPRALADPGSPLDTRLRHTGWLVTDLGCWEWRGNRNPDGYGTVAVGRKVGRSPKPAIASRAAYEAWVGTIPDGLVVCHRCDNPPCINPGHLFLGTRGDNNRDSVRKMRNSFGEHHDHKLSDAEVEEIRQRYRNSGVLQKDLAAEFGVSKSHIGLIVNGLRRRRPSSIRQVPAPSPWPQP